MRLIGYAAIRKSGDDFEFIDSSSFSAALSVSEVYVERASTENSVWHKMNPVQRFEQVEIKILGE